MGKFYYITYSSAIENVQLIKDRIKQFDDYINFFENDWFVYSDLTPKAIYDKLSKGGFENERIFIMEVTFTNYWGRMQKYLWDWIKKDRSDQ